MSTLAVLTTAENVHILVLSKTQHIYGLWP